MTKIGNKKSDYNVYVAGPMRGYKDFNFPLFDKVADRLRQMGWTVCNPADKDREEHGEDVGKSETGDLDEAMAKGFDLRAALAWDLNWIAIHGDAICLLPDWEKSSGAIAEYSLAKCLRLDILLWIEEDQELIKALEYPVVPKCQPFMFKSVRHYGYEEAVQAESFENAYIDRS